MERLEVILYGHDRNGLLDLRERSFPSMQDLAKYLTVPGPICWEWAELGSLDDDGAETFIRYSIADLRDKFSTCWSDKVGVDREI